MVDLIFFPLGSDPNDDRDCPDDISTALSMIAMRASSNCKVPAGSDDGF